MTIGVIPVLLTIPNDQTWIEDVRFWLDTAKTQPATIVSGEAWLRSKNPAFTSTYDMTVTNGRLVVSGGTVGIRAADISLVPPGSYTLEVQATDSSGVTRQVRGDIKVVAGLKIA